MIIERNRGDVATNEARAVLPDPGTTDTLWVRKSRISTISKGLKTSDVPSGGQLGPALSDAVAGGLPNKRVS